MPTHPEEIFKPSKPGTPVATLVLIENSCDMIHGWPDLRDHHLPTLLGTMRLANLIMPIQVLWLITSPLNDSDPSSKTNNQLPDIWFDPNPKNRISSSIINRGISLHLPPGDAYLAIEGPYGSQWQELAHKLYKEQIFLHIILNPGLDMHQFTSLFYNILNRQHRQEVPVWFRTSPGNYQFYLAGMPVSHSPQSRVSGLSNLEASVPTAQPKETLSLSEELRQCSHPISSLTEADIPQRSQGDDLDAIMPGLVTRLQKMHSLTKKKIYGSQPKPPPTTSAWSSTVAVKSPSAETHMPLRSKTERVRYLSVKGSLTTSPLESSSSGHHSPWFCRGSCSILPADSGSSSYPSSPTSASTFSANSPVLPTPQENLSAGVALEPSWLPSQTTKYFPPSPGQYTYPPTVSLSSPNSGDAICSGPTNWSADTTLTAGGNKPMSWPSLSLYGKGPNPSGSVNDQPFILSPEYEAAAISQFQAIFQPTKYKPEPQEFTSIAEPPVNYHSLHLRSSTVESHAMSFTTTRRDPLNTETTLRTSSLEGWDGQYPM